mmetsp:Transcript_5539/g.10825  ORF Transcript_5539/g.10825 Transcript_5539/m.10825 type:complete len:517 (-) Transcript_5539:268-1818(-)|eukprot:CAMPEP_0196131322 /NCGR_PEP_ID=MMETSP0910-20130528/1384_1 /TAXON_ID=49265 /ORGANISM="Thalassiosira rotula, Strain GSO102" /LENGTH=516 /DNA_ID=CAMNT_0041390787 /DNA_START=23 /DNA_END=1576 /DNA_ORIENTATION=+
MAHYKKDAASNRDALFGGGSGGGGGSSSRRATAPRAARPQQQQQQQQQRPSGASSSSSRTSAAAAMTSRPQPPSTSSLGYGASSDPSITPGPSSIFNSSARTARNAPIGLLTGQAKISKMAEAEDYRLKAKKAMTRGIFSKPDPISAANFYKRAADAYKQCGENRLERLHRIASGDCQLGQDAYATAAAEYTRAAELAESTEDETLPRKRQECHKLHLDAANAWSQMGERGRAAESTMKAAFGLIMGEDCKQQMNDKALKSVEEAIESFLGDPLNRKRNYRRTGVSAYAAGPSSEPTQQSLELAKQNIITDSYAHETLFKAGTELIKRRHYESALYAHGAGTAALEHEGYATVSLSRAYVSEAILLLAMGDAVAASADFQKVHLQRTAYLSSRECALEEDLIRACDAMDGEALEEARARTGPHRAALANLDPSLRELVGEIRVSGRAKKEKKEVAPTKNAAPAVVAKKPSPPKKSAEEVMKDTDDGFAEMDDIMNQMGLNDDDDNDDDSDDDIDLT